MVLFLSLIIAYIDLCLFLIVVINYSLIQYSWLLLLLYIISFTIIVSIVSDLSVYGIISSSLIVSAVLMTSLITVSGLPPSLLLLLKLAALLSYMIAFKLL